VGDDLTHVPGAGLLTGTVAAQRADRDAQPIRQPRHRSSGRGSHVLRDEPEPRQRAQLHRRAQHVVLAPELPNERLISRGEREVPDQLSTGRLGKPPQLRQLVL